MENLCAVPRNNNIIIVNEKFNDFIEEHKEESKKALQMHLDRALKIRKNKIK